MNKDAYQNTVGRIWKLPLLIILLCGAMFAGGRLIYEQNKNANEVMTGFEQCVAAGNPVMESYPEQCIMDGRTYINTDSVQ